ncbi:MAG: AAA family ATPase [Spirochaetales bacterium]|nr:AAA family ATPase [Spirochaetales bacterium]
MSQENIITDNLHNGNINFMKDTKKKINLYIQTGCPIIYIVTKEERRVIEVIRRIIIEHNLKVRSKMPELPEKESYEYMIWEWMWTCSMGLRLTSKPRLSDELLSFKTNCGVYYGKDIKSTRSDLNGSFCIIQGNPDVDYTFSATHALHQILNLHSRPSPQGKDVEWHENNLFIFLDLHEYLSGSRGGSTLFERAVSRYLRDIDYQFRWNRMKPDSSGYSLNRINSIILISPEERIPEGLSRSVKVIKVPLPRAEELDGELKRWQKTSNIELVFNTSDDNGEKTKEKYISRGIFLNGAKGLTRDQFIDFLNEHFTLEMEKQGREIKVNYQDLKELLLQKKEYVESGSGHALEYLLLPTDMDSVGGLHNLKNWLTIRKRAFCENDRKNDRGYALPKPKGLLLVGIPGGGKSLSAKAIAHAWQIPCVRLDMGALREGIVGASERKLENAITICESIAPAVLWIDEVEKGFVGKETGGDSGVSMRIYSRLLTWMQEKTEPIFMVATANDISLLDAAFKRPGRFDNIMTVGLPSIKSCKEIIQIHYKKIWIKYYEERPQQPVQLEDGQPDEERSQQPVLDDEQLDELSLIAFTNRLSGAAIEKRMQDAIYIYVFKYSTRGLTVPTGIGISVFEKEIVNKLPGNERKDFTENYYTKDDGNKKYDLITNKEEVLGKIKQKLEQIGYNDIHEIYTTIAQSLKYGYPVESVRLSNELLEEWKRYEPADEEQIIDYKNGEKIEKETSGPITF